MLFWSIIIFSATMFVAYANGANDNFKGVATLLGSGTSDYQKALWWATVTTFAGSMTALFLATKLVETFQGRGLIPESLTGSGPFAAAVILGTGLTLFLATKIGAPISTTHSLTGALIGSGLMAVGSDFGFVALWDKFLIPLLLSPLIAVGLAVIVYPLFRLSATFIGLTRETCICAGEELVPVAITPGGHFMTTGTKSVQVVVDQEANCAESYTEKIFGVNAQTALGSLHYLSAGALSFARGLNDTPKIVALSLTAGTLDLRWCVYLVALFMALGGLFHAQRVAETMSKRITEMDFGQGFAANLVASFLVIFASRWGLPVSTTHVSCGALFGIGAVNGKARWGVVRSIVLAWVLTLPVAALLSGGIFTVLQDLIGKG
ncbi:MAG: inorganic phosphate transporter [Candidatus Binatia bacterium]